MTIRERRIVKNMTQEELAQKSGVSRVNICRIEIGKRNLSLNAAIKLARALGCTIDELVGAPDKSA